MVENTEDWQELLTKHDNLVLKHERAKVLHVSMTLSIYVYIHFHMETIGTLELTVVFTKTSVTHAVWQKSFFRPHFTTTEEYQLFL